MSGHHSRETGRTYDVLLIEKEPEDVGPFKESFETTDATEEVHVVTDGDEALDFINRRGAYSQAPRPDLIILDLHVQGADGEKILTELNEQPGLRLTPVLVITSSDRAEDIARSYELDANAFLRKPSSEAEFTTLARAIEDFWLEQAHLPPK